MKTAAKIPLDEGVLAYLQMLAFEVDGLRVLNCQIMQSGGGRDVCYDRFLERYQEASRTYRMAFGEVVGAAAPEYLGPEYRHEVSFLTGELIVSRKEGAE